MRRKPSVRRAITGLLAACLIPLGLLPATAHAAAQAAPGPNLALGRPATASGANGQYGAGNVTDGNQSSYWEGPSASFPQWVRVDLGATTSVDEVTLKLPTTWEARDETLTVQGSTDGSTWSTLSASAKRTFTPNSANAVTVGFGAADVRYVRVQVSANTGWQAAQLSELEIRGEGDDGGTDPGDPGTPPVTGTNLAKGKPVEANGYVHTFLPANANDGDTNTYWESAGLPGQLTVKLGADADISGIVVKLNPGTDWGARTQAIEAQGRGQNASGFSTLKARADYAFNPAGNKNTVTIPVTGRAADVRLNIAANSGAPGGQIAEVEVVGTAAPNPDLTLTDLTWTPTTPSEKDAVTVRTTVRNAGTAASPATTVDVSLDGTVAGSAPVGALAAGASQTVSVDVGKRPQGSYTVSAVVDPKDTVVEQDNSNNSRSGASKLVVSQSPGPDLQVTGIATNPDSPAAGANVSFTVAVKNRGTSAVAAGTVTRLTAGTTTLNGTTPAVPAGETVQVAISGTWKATDGGATLTATADATNTVTETDENNNTFARSIVVGRGAAVPYTEYEAEDGKYTGTLLTADAKRTFGHTNFATESSGRKSVRLNSTGQYVEFTSTTPTNSIVVRNSIPDAANGGGQNATLSLYANGQFVRKLDLSSKHSWLYGSTDDPEGLTNTPGGDARRLFDEANALLTQTYPVGTTFRLQRDAGDNASFYIVDLVDLEQVAPAKSKPAECASITEYGAVPNDGIDDTDAIQRAVMADQNGQIPCVWIPAGQWRQEQKILTPDPQHRGQYNQVGIKNVKIVGAGMWHSQLYTLTEPQDAGGINHPHEGNFGFDIDDNTQISDLAIFGSGRIRGGDGNDEGGVGINGRLGKNTKISNVWIEHANVGVWVGRDYSNIPELWNPGDGLEFSGMRIRDTYADGINFTNGTHNSTVYNSSFRNTGDDSLAVWSSKYVKDPSTDVGANNHFRNNTIQLPWRANGIAVYGGYGNTIENNVVSDTMNYPGIMLATDHDPIPFSGQTLIAGNTLHRTGGAFWNEDQEFGAITLFAQGASIPGVTIRDTDILDSTYDGIQFKTGGGTYSGVKISNVRIDKSNNGSGILAMSGARGDATLSNVTISNSRDGDVLVEPGSQFTITGAPTKAAAKR
ncbi:CARDB domain-containing protein [Streptomyces sp. DSM 41982]|uniref:CARDB domain-containing protein n=1 Tax=Streptomyces evansiae TaxID=3075535 RepID=A0ABD5EA18_9ACTN|nr:MULTISPECIES: CARDB domain-containing protein [unclassified Streptomyces]MDT0418249.1 CARDB domain-containing protein [Streptomyces sp. DSM 41982]SCE22545.1 F5/8 type C domain-containing protein [Streptomyces sp. SolWspMP-sol7th]